MLRPRTLALVVAAAVVLVGSAAALEVRPLRAHAHTPVRCGGAAVCPFAFALTLQRRRVQGVELHQTLEEMKAADDAKYTKSHKKFRSVAVPASPARLRVLRRATTAHASPPRSAGRFFDTDGSDSVTRDEFEAGPLAVPCRLQRIAARFSVVRADHALRS